MFLKYLTSVIAHTSTYNFMFVNPEVDVKSAMIDIKTKLSYIKTKLNTKKLKYFMGNDINNGVLYDISEDMDDENKRTIDKNVNELVPFYSNDTEKNIKESIKLDNFNYEIIVQTDTTILDDTYLLRNTINDTNKELILAELTNYYLLSVCYKYQYYTHYKVIEKISKLKDEKKFMMQNYIKDIVKEINEKYNKLDEKIKYYREMLNVVKVIRCKIYD